MNKKFKLALAIVSVTFLAACGGGGGSSSGGAAVNPLQKYEGKYYFCDSSGHTRQIATVTATGSSSLSVATVAEIYQNTNCSGSIVGTYSESDKYTLSEIVH